MVMFRTDLALLRREVTVLALTMSLAAGAAGAKAPAPDSATLRVSARSVEINPPITSAPQPRTDSVILKPGRASDTLRSLRVKRRIPIAALRQQPVLSLGSAEADLSPLFRNPKSPLVLAESLRAQPDLAIVLAQNVEVSEVDQGLIVHQYLAYRLKPAACATRTARARLARSGVTCFERMTPQSRAVAFADPADPHYVAQPARRAQSLAAAEAKLAAEQAKIAADTKTLRAALADPAQRQAIEAIAGSGSAIQLATLSDEQLQEEMINRARVEIEDEMFVPAAMSQRLAPGSIGSGRVPPRLRMAEDIAVDQPIAKHVYLTGFTFGRGYEWRHRESITVDWCLVDCSSTYYLELYAGLGYGLGLRFPVQLGGVYHFQRQGGQESASITTSFQPINGSAKDYTDAGVPDRELFGGKELVAQLNAYAGMAYKVPLYSDNMKYEVGKDLTDDLPPPFAQGQFAPPAPGNALERETVFDSPDLLGGLADYGVAGARVLPAVKFGLTSGQLGFTLKDNISGASRTITQSGETAPLAVSQADHSSDFSIGQPVYNLAFEVTPGIAARLFVDVSVWSHHWDWPVWFPQLAIKLTPAGATFTCHASTICSRDYHYAATTASEAVGETMLPDDPIEQNVELALRAFRARWVPKCPLESPAICVPQIDAIIADMRPKMVEDIRADCYLPAGSTIGSCPVPDAAMLDIKGRNVIRDANIRSTRSYGEGLIKLNEPVWNKDCADLPCRDRIHEIGLDYVHALLDAQNANPEFSSDQIVAQVNIADYAARAKKEVTASLLRRTLRVRPPRVGG